MGGDDMSRGGVISIGIIQFRPPDGDLSKARSQALSLCQSCIDVGADLVVFPELALTRYLFSSVEDARSLSETSDGESARQLQMLADRSQTHIVFGFIEDAGEQLYNSALILRPRQSPLLYRKRCLFVEDERWAAPGDLSYPLWTIRDWRCTVGICMDLNDDSFIEWCHSAEVQCIAFPTNWLDEGIDIRPYWAARISGTGALLAAANSYGEEGAISFRGESSVLNERTLFTELPAQGDGWRLITLQRRDPTAHER